MLNQYTIIIKNRIYKLNYILNKINKYMYGGDNTKIKDKVNIINNTVEESKKIKNNMDILNTKLNNYNKNLNIILSKIEDIDKTEIYLPDTKNLEKILDLKKIYNKNHILYDTKYFTDDEIFKSLKLMYTGLYNDLNLQNKKKFEEEFYDYNLKNLELKIDLLKNNANEYNNKIKKLDIKQDIIIISDTDINNEFKNKDLIVKNISQILFNIENIVSVIPTDLELVIDFGNKLKEDIEEKKEIIKFINDKNTFPKTQIGGLTYDEKVNKLFSLSIKLEECNKILQEIFEKNEINEKYIINSDKLYNSIIDILNIKTTKIYHYVNLKIINIFLEKIKKKEEDIYIILRNIFKKIKEKIKEDEYIKILNIQNKELKKAFSLFNAIMNEEI